MSRMALPIVTRGVCPHDCPDTCSFDTTVVDGVATRLTPVADHPVTRGFLCTKVNRYLERTYAADRVATPLKRVGPKGTGEFRTATWNEALADISLRLKSIVDSHGAQSILPYSYAGTMGLIQRESMSARFFHRLGASLLDRTICASAGTTAWMHTYGSCDGPGAEEIGENELIILWGTNTLTSNPHLWPAIRKARDSGATLVCIDPLRTRTARAADIHIALRPGSDAALALGVMHVLFRDDHADAGFLNERAHGWEELRDHVLTQWSVERAADLCDLPPQEIHMLAKRYGSTQRSFIRFNYGMQRHLGGGSAVRAGALLPAVTGAWRHPGSGATLSTSSAYLFDKEALQRPDWIPVGTRRINMNQLDEALTKPDAGVGGPGVHGLVVYNSNPATVAPNSVAVRSGLAREDLFTVVIEQFMTDTAHYADWVLPATTQLEHHDLHAAYGHHFASLNTPAIAPVGESLPNSEIFRRLARAMDFDDPEFGQSDVELIELALAGADGHLSWEVLSKVGYERVQPAGQRHYTTGRLATPSGKIECVADTLTDYGLPALPDFIEPLTWQQTTPGSTELTLLTPPQHEFLNSSFANIPRLSRAAGEQTLLMNPVDAQTRELNDGDAVLIANDRGSFPARLIVTPDARPGTVAAFGLRWAGDGSTGVNAVTGSGLTDLGRGATFYDTAVTVGHR